MKSEIFKSAWELVKQRGITLSLALKIAWADFKVTNLWTEYNKFTCMTRGAESFEIYKKIKVLQKFMWDNTPALTIYATINNDGARHDYGIGAYNGD